MTRLPPIRGFGLTAIPYNVAEPKIRRDGFPPLTRCSSVGGSLIGAANLTNFRLWSSTNHVKPTTYSPTDVCCGPRLGKFRGQRKAAGGIGIHAIV